MLLLGSGILGSFFFTAISSLLSLSTESLSELEFSDLSELVDFTFICRYECYNTK